MLWIGLFRGVTSLSAIFCCWKRARRRSRFFVHFFRRLDCRFRSNADRFGAIQAHEPIRRVINYLFWSSPREWSFFATFLASCDRVKCVSKSQADPGPTWPVFCVTPNFRCLAIKAVLYASRKVLCGAVKWHIDCTVRI